MLGKQDGQNFLCEFDLEIKHIKGKENKVADALSRKVQEIHVASISIFQSDLRQHIVILTTGDELYEQVKDKLQQQSIEKRYEGYKLEEDGLLTYKNRIYILNVAYLRRVVMDEIHQAPYSSHPGYQKTIATTRKQYFWPGMKKDMAKYISRCMKCQQVKVEHQHRAGLLQPFPVTKWKWEVISMDFTTGFPMTLRQHDSIMVVVENLTKESHFILVNSTYKADSIAKIFMKEIFKLHGFPKAVVSERDVKFNSNFWKGLFANLGTNLNFSTAYWQKKRRCRKNIVQGLKTASEVQDPKTAKNSKFCYN